MQLYLGEKKINGAAIYKDGNMPGFLTTPNGDMVPLSPEVELENNPLTATAKRDLRVGTVAITNEGIVKGEKNFPSYETTTGVRYVPVGRELEVVLQEDDKYDYTDFQSIICIFNTSTEDSFGAEKVVIKDSVYLVSSGDFVSNITKDVNNKSIKFGTINTGEKPVIIRYYTHKVV